MRTLWEAFDVPRPTHAHIHSLSSSHGQTHTYPCVLARRLMDAQPSHIQTGSCKDSNIPRSTRAQTRFAIHVVARKSQAKSPLSGHMQRVHKNGIEETPDEISILRWLEMGPENFFRGSPTRNRHFSGCQRNSPVAPESDRRVFLEEVWAGIANSPVSPHLAIIILKGRMEEPENRDSTKYFLQKHSPVASLSDRRIRGLVSATLYRGPGA